MTTFVARRLLLLPLVAFGVTILIFALLQFLTPAQRAALFVTDPRQLSQIDAIIRKYGLDKPVHVQYWTWLKQFPPGRLSLDADLFVKSPEFHRYTRLMTVDALLNGQPWIFVDALRHIVGPAMTLVLVEMALIVRITRSSMLEVLRQDYVRTARAKGLAEPVVINRHARKNALIPVVTLTSLIFVGLLGGVVLAETIFNYPGIGKWGAEAAVQLDIPGVTGFGMFIALVTVVGNLAADILYAAIDPRIRLQ